MDSEIYFFTDCLIFKKCEWFCDKIRLKKSGPIKIENDSVSEFLRPGWFYFVGARDMKFTLENHINEGTFELTDERFDYNRFSESKVLPGGILKEVEREEYRGIEIIYYTYKKGEKVWYFATYEYRGRIIGAYDNDILTERRISDLKWHIDYFVFGEE